MILLKVMYKFVVDRVKFRMQNIQTLMSMFGRMQLVASKILNLTNKTGRAKNNEKAYNREWSSDKLRPFSEIKTLTFSFS